MRSFWKVLAAAAAASVGLTLAAQEVKTGAPIQPVVGRAVKFSVSPPLSDLPPVVRPSLPEGE